MHIPTHIMSGWCVGNLLPLNPRQRLFCMIAATVADLDGVGFVISEEAYWNWHHIAGHNIFYAVLVAGVLTAFSQPRRMLAFVAYLALFHLHLLLDYFGSGPGWKIHYFWPVSDVGYATSLAWGLTSWQNITAAAILLAWTVLVAWQKRRTPLEAIMPNLDRQLVALLPGHPRVTPAPEPAISE